MGKAFIGPAIGAATGSAVRFDVMVEIDRLMTAAGGFQIQINIGCQQDMVLRHDVQQSRVRYTQA